MTFYTIFLIAKLTRLSLANSQLTVFSLLRLAHSALSLMSLKKFVIHTHIYTNASIPLVSNARPGVLAINNPKSQA